MKTNLLKFSLLIYLLTQQIDAAKILGVFPVAARSHYSLGNALLRGLAEAGHDVTMISPHEDTLPTKKGSYRNIVLTGFAETYEAYMKKVNVFKKAYINSFTYFLNFVKPVAILMDNIFSHPNTQRLLNSNESFDVVIVEQVACEALKIFAHHFKAHLVLFSSVAADSKLNYLVGNPTMLSYTPQIDTNFSTNMCLYQRIYNTLLYLFESFIMHYHWLPTQDKLLKKHFPDAPSLLEINYNVSLILVNSHVSIQPAIPLVPTIIPIGGFHIQKPKELPTDLQEFLDNAKEGVVYVSLGSSVTTANLPEHKRNAFLETFANLKQKVLWKWEDESIDNLPNNVKVAKWFPQMDVLAHPNVKLFVTQGGLLSLTETIYNAVPILVLPILGDQGLNGQIAVSGGFGKSISFHDPNFNSETLIAMANELLNNPQYQENVQRRSLIYHDRKMSPKEEAVYWIEYVINHNGAAHLKVPGTKLPWYQHYLIDVICIILSIILLGLFTIYSIIKCLFCLLKCDKNTITKKERKIKKN